MTALINLYDSVAARAVDENTRVLQADDGYGLMLQAGQAAWCILQKYWPQAQKLVVFCGAGNNGGDGYVLASLAQQAGKQVVAVHLPQSLPATPLAQRACAAYQALGGEVKTWPVNLDNADVVVDALFGIGMSRVVDEPVARLIDVVNASGKAVLSLDVPSGIDAQTGRVWGWAIRASVTVQFIVQHLGLYTGAALDYVGRCLLEPLQVPVEAFDDVSPCAHYWHKAELVRLPPRCLNTHKGESGQVLCVGGDNGSGGAIMLCAEAALRSGAGLVSVVTRQAHITALLSRCPEAMAHGVEQVQKSAVLGLFNKAKVLALGPGLGQQVWGRQLFKLLIQEDIPAVIDADAINLLAQNPRQLPRAILTPHPAEAARLLGVSTAEVQQDRLYAAVELAHRYKAVVVLKGAGTVVAAVGQLPVIIGAGNPGMATGGMGDVLTGVIAALYGQGLDSFSAATRGAWIHAKAGDLAAFSGQRGLLPTDLLQYLRQLLN